MPVWKFRNAEEARRALWLPSGDPRIFERLQRLGEFVIAPEKKSQGVTRFRSIEEAKRDKLRRP